MKKKLLVALLSVAILASLVFGVALAGSYTFDGAVTASSPTTRNVAINGYGCGGIFNTSGFNAMYYDTRAFKVTVSGAYTFTDLGAALAAPYVNVGMALNDSSGKCLFGGSLGGGAVLTLVANQTYTMQVTPWWVCTGAPAYPCVASYKVGVSGPGDIIPLPHPDDRINWDSSQAGPVALYCRGEGAGTLEVWAIDPSSGVGVYEFSWNKWDDPAPAANTKLKGNGGQDLWHLSSGEFQVNAYYVVYVKDAEGNISPVWKGYSFIFSGCPYHGGGVANNFDPNQK